jgi:hypothetical protein
MIIGNLYQVNCSYLWAFMDNHLGKLDRVDIQKDIKIFTNEILMYLGSEEIYMLVVANRGTKPCGVYHKFLHNGKIVFLNHTETTLDVALVPLS